MPKKKLLKIKRIPVKTLPIKAPAHKTEQMTDNDIAGGVLTGQIINTVVADTAELLAQSTKTDYEQRGKPVLSKPKYNGAVNVKIGADKLVPLDTEGIKVTFEKQELPKKSQKTNDAQGATKPSIRQRILEWRKKSEPPKTLNGADPSELPFAWSHPITLTTKGEYKSSTDDHFDI